MKPLKDRAREGRANPKGIPFLYVATNRETACAEVRPWIGSSISLAQFRTRQLLRLVDCTIHQTLSPPNVFQQVLLNEVPAADEREERLWSDVDDAFATPAASTDDVASYVPTQIIAEHLKVNAFHGVKYRSSLEAGRNIALFDVDAADIVSRCLVLVQGMKFTFSASYVVEQDAGPNEHHDDQT